MNDLSTKVNKIITNRKFNGKITDIQAMALFE